MDSDSNFVLDQKTRTALDSSEILHNVSLSRHDLAWRSLRRGRITTDAVCGRPACGLVTSGELDVYNVAADGHEVRLARLTENDCFGLANLFADSSLKTVLKCRKNAEILFIDKQALRRAVSRDPRLAKRLCTFYGNKIDFLLQRIELLTMHRASGKLSEYLLEICAENDSLVMTQTKSELASQLGISRATLYRELDHLKEMGMIDVDGKIIRIINRDSLSDMAGLRCA